MFLQFTVTGPEIHVRMCTHTWTASTLLNLVRVPGYLDLGTRSATAVRVLIADESAPLPRYV